MSSQNDLKKIDNEKRGQFMQYIEEIAKLPSLSDNDVENYLNLFENLYEYGFRHFYSDILIVLLKLDKDASEKNTVVLEQLPANLEILQQRSIKKNIKCSEKLTKLYDHCLMDCSRIQYWKEQNEIYKNFCSNTEVEIAEYSKILDNIKNEFKDDIKEMRSFNTEFKNDKLKLEKETDDLKKESKEIKKDLVSIMGIFLGIFLFFQMNFTQLKDLLEYDPFSRMLYLVVFNIIFLVGLYLIFVIIDFLIHGEPRLLKLIIDIEKKLPNKLGGICIILYVIILCTCGYFLYSDKARKTISRLESNIEETNEKTNKILNEKIQIENNKRDKEINDLKEIIKKLENNIKEINKNNKTLGVPLKN